MFEISFSSNFYNNLHIEMTIDINDIGIVNLHDFFMCINVSLTYLSNNF